MTSAVIGAIAAGIVVIAIGAAVRRPLTMVPENWMKFGVGAMLSSFGVFWFAEGLGVTWPGDALSLFPILAIFLVTTSLAPPLLRALLPDGAEIAGRNI